MAKIRSWEVSDEFWKRVEPLVPARERESAGRSGGSSVVAARPCPPGGVRGYRLCAENRVSVEGLAQGTVWKCKLRTQVLPAMAQSRVLPDPLACRIG